jgi:HK97 family phage prohead protease
MEYKSIGFELKDIDKGKRTAQVAHAVYNNIDRTKDISRKGMFSKSWKESKDQIAFYFNHDDTQAPGKVMEVYETEQKAYTGVWLGNHTLGNDVLTMMDEGVVRWASFGYIEEKSNQINVKGEMVRELKEVQHLETSVLTKFPANPKAGVETVVKSLVPKIETKMLSSSEETLIKKIMANDQDTLETLVGLSSELLVTDDLYTWIMWQISRRADMIGDLRCQMRYNSQEVIALKSHITTMENFCRNTKASDDSIKIVLKQIEDDKQLLSKYDTASTPLITEPDASKTEQFRRMALLIKNKL